MNIALYTIVLVLDSHIDFISLGCKTEYFDGHS